MIACSSAVVLQALNSLGLRSLGTLGHTEDMKLLPSLLQIVVHDNLVVNSRGLCILHFVLRLRQSLLNCFLFVSSSTSETLLQNLEGRWLKEEEACVEIGLLDLFHALQNISIIRCYGMASQR